MVISRNTASGTNPVIDGVRGSIFLVYGAPHGARMHAVDFARLVDDGALVTVCNLIHATTWTCQDSAERAADLLRAHFPTWRFEVRAQR